MKLRTTLKTLIRSPLKSLLTLLLLTATTFAFVSRGVEYVATVQQIRAAEATYFATGTVEMTLSAYEDAMYERLGEKAYTLEGGNYLGRTSRAILPMDSKVADKILLSEYIDKSEVRLVSGGTHRDCWSVLEQPLSDLEQYDPNNKYTSSGTFAMSDAVFIGTTPKIIQDGFINVWTRRGISIYPGNFYISTTQTESSMTESFSYIADDAFWTELRNRGRNKPEMSEYWMTLRANFQYDDRILFVVGGGNGNTRSILPCIDYPMINLTRIEREYGETDLETILKNPEAYGCLHYSIAEWKYLLHPNTGKHESEFLPIPHSDDEMMNIFDYFETVERNRHTSEVVYTSDMNLIHKYKSGDMYISDGRALAENEQSEVCVIGADFAELNGLSVGDTITLDLCADTMVHSGKVFGRETPYPTDRDVVSEDQLTERGLPNVTKTFEIVGIWSDAAFDVEDPYTYALNTIFVPESCYPWAGQVEPSLLPSTFSFELKHPGDAALLKAEIGDELAALGYELKINDGGYAAAKPNLDFMRLSALIGFVAMCVGLLLCLVLITYLFIIRKKKDYAIMRALGTTKSRSNRSLLSALLTLALIAVTIGAFVAGFAAQSAAAKAAAEVAELTGVETTGVGAWEFTIAFAVGTLGLVFTFARAGLIKISRTPPLALLQGR